MADAKQVPKSHSGLTMEEAPELYLVEHNCLAKQTKKALSAPLMT